MTDGHMPSQHLLQALVQLTRVESIIHGHLSLIDLDTARRLLATWADVENEPDVLPRLDLEIGRLHDPIVICIVARQGNTVIGIVVGTITASRRSKILTVHQIYVHRSHRNSGLHIGNLLVLALHTEAFDRQVRLWTLSTAMRTEYSTVGFWQRYFNTVLMKTGRSQVLQHTREIANPPRSDEAYGLTPIHTVILDAAPVINAGPVASNAEREATTAQPTTSAEHLANVMDVDTTTWALDTCEPSPPRKPDLPAALLALDVMVVDTGASCHIETAEGATGFITREATDATISTGLNMRSPCSFQGTHVMWVLGPAPTYTAVKITRPHVLCHSTFRRALFSVQQAWMECKMVCRFDSECAMTDPHGQSLPYFAIRGSYLDRKSVV